MIQATQFSTMRGPVGDPWIGVYPQHWKQSRTQFHALFMGYTASSLPGASDIDMD